MNSNITSLRLSNSWRYITPSKLNSQDKRRAFELRTFADGTREAHVSFDANTFADGTREEKRSEIYRIYEKKQAKGFGISKNGRFIMVDLNNAQIEANFTEERILAKIDGQTHCAMYYLNGCYDDSVKMIEILGILYHNTLDSVPTYREEDGQFTICSK